MFSFSLGAGLSQRSLLPALLLLCSLLLLAGCQHSARPLDSRKEQAIRERLAPLPLPDHSWSSQALKKRPEQQSSLVPMSHIQPSDEPELIWDRLRNGFHLDEDAHQNPRIDQQRLWYATRVRSIEITAQRSSPYIYYIVEALDKRKMPLELALLPVIESSYNPMVLSPSQAAGLWQFIPSTGRNFKLKQTRWYDGRRDILASTQAALDYLQYLHRMFDGDWLLALAAYNAGEGTVGRAIKRNRSLGLPTDYWNLQLPQQTQDYVPRLLAVAQLIASPQAHNLKLPDVPNAPYFARVPLKGRLGLKQIASLAQISTEHINELNPAFKQGIVHDGPAHVLVPAEHADRLEQKLSELGPQSQPLPALQAPPTPSLVAYRVVRGDTLSGIAQRHKVTVAQLKQWNQLKNNNLRIGQTLSLRASQPAKQGTASYSVKKGDSLYSIARGNGISLQQLQKLNPGVSRNLQPGQSLRLKP